jgi:hypothetical protein
VFADSPSSMASIQKHGASLVEFSESTPKELDASLCYSENSENGSLCSMTRRPQNLGGGFGANSKYGVVRQTVLDNPGMHYLISKRIIPHKSIHDSVVFDTLAYQGLGPAVSSGLEGSNRAAYI